MPDVGFTHVALPVTDLDTSVAFYAKFARFKVVHRRPQAVHPDREIAWLNDGMRPFVLVLSEGAAMDRPLGPFAHLGVACVSRAEVDRLSDEARREGRLRDEPWDSNGPAGYLTFLDDPDGHTLELSYGQEVGLTVERAG